LVVGVVHVIAESVNIIAPALNLADTLSSETSNVLRHIFDILLGIVPLVLHAVLGVVVVVLNVLGNVFDLTDLCNKLVCDGLACSYEAYLATSPASCVLRGILHAVLETVEVAFGSVLVFFPVLLDFVTLVHEQCTTSKSSCSTHGSVCYVVVLLLLRLLLFVTAVLLALRGTLVVTGSVAAAVSTSLARVLESAFAILLVDKEPAVLTVVPDSAPWRWDLGCALASAVALLLTAVALLRAAIALLLATVTLLGTAVVALGWLIVVVAALVVATLLAAAATLALATSELTDQIAEQTHDVKCV
jgi:hypothetical protein